MTTPAKRFSREEITHALARVAWHNGSTGRAHRELLDAGWSVSRQALDLWKTKHADLYEQCVSSLVQAIIPQTEVAARSSLDVIHRSNEVVLDAYDAGAVDPKDASTFARNAAVTYGITVEKSQLLKGQPTERVEVDLYQALNEMNRIAASLPSAQVVDSTAIEEESE